MNGRVERRPLMAPRSLAWVASICVAACALNDLGPDGDPGGTVEVVPVNLAGQIDTTPETDAASASAAVCESAPIQAAEPTPDAGTNRQMESARCPKDMNEVDGLYCTDVMHRCTKGGRTHTEEATEEPEPYYCDGYLPGFSKCLDKEEPMHFCIDTFEYPNQEGTIPTVMVSWYEAKRLCEQQNKRLCGDDEWTLACEGPERFPFPYGWVRDKRACNTDYLWTRPNDGLLGSRTANPKEIQAEVERLSRRTPSGSKRKCQSPYGVMDMVGNVDEWTTNVTYRGKPYQSAFKGGHWISGARNRCRPITVSHDETTYYYSEGFRCCADPGGA